MKRYSVLAVLFLFCFESFSLFAAAKSKFKYLDEGIVSSQRKLECGVSRHAQHPCQGSEKFHRASEKPAFRGKGNPRYKGASCDCYYATQSELAACGGCSLPQKRKEVAVKLEPVEEETAASSQKDNKNLSNREKLRQKIKEEQALMQEKQKLGLDTGAEETNIRAYQKRLRGLSFRTKQRK